ncbi:YtzI protein [Niallia sp. XMNu-256]|uniref:YtzI protein n=1 Tax=Niallia sp. XMNu-256 TaxID=3082444 RepID=UPI0030D0A40B
MSLFTTILIISGIIFAIVLFLCVITTSKAYQFKHTVDPLPKEKKQKHEES